MDITPIIPQGKKLLTGYGAGGFKINNEWVSGSLLVFGDQALNWPVANVDGITFESLQPVLDYAPAIELLLIGTGKSTSPINPALRQALRARHIAVDAMDSGAACRTYNVLLSEERQVAAALLAI